jgi:murein DD-endopeptidase MepM/ murein hydrolase activator NlpD
MTYRSILVLSVLICLLTITHLVRSAPPVPTLLEVTPTVKQGDTVKVRFSADTLTELKMSKPVTASLLGRSVTLYELDDEQPNGNTTWLEGYLPVSVMAKPGKALITLTDANQQRLPVTADTMIKPAYFPVQNIRAGKAIKGLEPLPGEMEAVQHLKNRQTPVKWWRIPFLSPTVDCENSPFGVLRAHNGKLTGDYHKGVDLRSPHGRPVRATAAGRVVISQAFRLHGGTVGVDHGQGVNSIYIHLSKRLVKEGDVVAAGTPLGLVGATGFATGPHLHWGLYVNGLPVNPNQWLAPVPKCG